MKKYLGIFLLFVYIFSATELKEFIKVPELIDHYRAHKSEHNRLSVFDFLSMHYNNTGQHGQENESDKQLPFKSHTGSITFLCNALPPGLQSIMPLETGVSIKPVPLEDFQFRSFSANIWQPPKQL